MSRLSLSTSYESAVLPPFTPRLVAVVLGDRIGRKVLYGSSQALDKIVTLCCIAL